MELRRPRAERIAAALLFAALCTCSPPESPTAARPLVARPLVIAHRGASGYLPEETLAAYQLAIRLGADFLEPDLFMTADGVLVARHDRSLGTTTNVLEVAARDSGLAAKRTSEGAFYVDRLNYADLRKLCARSRSASGYAPNEGQTIGSRALPIATFQEVLDLAYDTYRATGRVIGVYPEIKTITGPGAVSYHRELADRMLELLTDAKYQGYFNGELNNVYPQSFDEQIVRYLHTKSTLPTIYLTGCPHTEQAASVLSTFAAGIGVSRSELAASTDCVERAHAAGLLVHVYTLLADRADYEQVLAWGVDGVFTNHPDVAKAARDALFPSPRSTLRPQLSMK